MDKAILKKARKMNDSAFVFRDESGHTSNPPDPEYMVRMKGEAYLCVMMLLKKFSSLKYLRHDTRFPKSVEFHIQWRSHLPPIISLDDSQSIRFYDIVDRYNFASLFVTCLRGRLSLTSGLIHTTFEPSTIYLIGIPGLEEKVEKCRLQLLEQIPQDSIRQSIRDITEENMVENLESLAQNFKSFHNLKTFQEVAHVISQEVEKIAMKEVLSS